MAQCNGRGEIEMKASPSARSARRSGGHAPALTRRRDPDLAVAGHSSFYPDVQ
jgi:hypothetical protein